MNSVFFSRNRSKLHAAIQQVPIVVTAYHLMQASNDVTAPFHQESSFWWLTGIEEPGWKLLIDGHRSKATLVRPARSTVDVVFNGATNDEAIMKMSGVDAIIEANDFEAHLRQIARDHTVVATIANKQDDGFVANPAQHDLQSILRRVFTSVRVINKELAELRAIKQPEEIKALKTAIKLTCDTFRAVREQLAQYTHEYEVEADFTAAFRRKNARHAYEPIVASGANAVTLHYTKNSGRIAKNTLTVIDIGAEVDGYAADITRTYAMSPSKRQQEVHRVVVQAQKDIIRLLGPDVLVADYIKQSDEIMSRAISQLGLTKDETSFRTYFPHSVSHGLGIDVHDSLGMPRYFRPGMVLTVEPGIYIPEENIGVRIEDDILITEKGRQNLSAQLSTDW